MQKEIFDNHGRPIHYLRLAVTDRCNLRCFYCMPEHGIDYVPRKQLLTYEEMERIVRVLVSMGVHKVRITGGEPLVRKGILDFIERLNRVEGLKAIHLTTNGTMTANLVPQLLDAGVKSVNLSLDTLDQNRFFEITRRDMFSRVMTTFDALLDHRVPTKINMVVMEGKNTRDIIPMAELTKTHPIGVRYIEEMPFNGNGARMQSLNWNYRKIIQALQAHFPAMEKIPDPPNSTSLNYKIPGYQGTIGVIPAYSRTFCGTCNRIRITPKGLLKTCLYDSGVFNIRDLIRSGASDAQLETAFLDAFGHRAKDGFVAEKSRFQQIPVSESMSSIGG